MSITHYDCVFVDVGTQREMRIGHIVICGLSGSTLLFPHYLINGNIFEKKKLPKIMCVLNFFTTFVCSISHSKKIWARYDKKMYSLLAFLQSGRYSCQVLMELGFSRQIFGKTPISNLIKILPVASELFNADRQTDRWTNMTKLIVAFCNFANEPINNIYMFDTPKMVGQFTINPSTIRRKFLENLFIARS